jgi:hypothetical protein
LYMIQYDKFVTDHDHVERLEEVKNRLKINNDG